MATHIVEYLQLLACQIGAIVQRQRRIVDQARHMRQPHLEEAQFDEYQLIVLREVTETGHTFRELHNPLDAGRDARRELLPQPDLLELQALRHGGDNLYGME